MEILIVDDEPQVAEVLAKSLERQGHRTSVVHSGKSPSIRLGDRRENRFSLVGACCRRDRAGDQALRVVDENAGRCARRCANDSSAGGIGSRFGDARELHRTRIGEQCVTVDPR